MTVVHRVDLPIGAVPMVEPGDAVEPAEVLATRRAPGPGTSIAVAARLRRPSDAAAACLRAPAGAVLEAGAVLASHGSREVRVPQACLFLGYDAEAGSALVAPLGGSETIIGHVRGEVASVESGAIEIAIAGALVAGIGGSGGAAHGALHVAVASPGDELRATAIGHEAAGRILVGGSRASAETLTRARAMGVAGIVLGGLLDKDLRDFVAAQQRRREASGAGADLPVLVIGGYGKVGLDPNLFAWFVRHEGRLASLFGDAGRLYVYDAEPPPSRRALPRPGDRVIAHRRPYAGMSGEVTRVLDRVHAAPSGVAVRSAIVRFADGPTAVVPLANLEATEPAPGA